MRSRSSDREEKNLFESSLKLLAKSSLIFFGFLVISKVLSYVYRIVIARNFGTEVYGLFSLAVIISTIVGALAGLGLTDGLLRFIPLYRGQNRLDLAKIIFKKSRNLLIVLGLTAGAILFVFSDIVAIRIFHDEALSPFLKLFSATIPFTLLSILFLAMLRSFESVGWYSFINNVVQNASRVVLLVVLFALGIGERSISISYILSTIIVALFAIIIFKKVAPPAFFKKSSVSHEKYRKAMRELFAYSWPLLFSGLTFYLFYWADSLLLGYFKGAQEVGLYNIAVPIAMILVFIPDLFLQLFFPLITKHYGEKKNKVIEELSKQVQKWIFFFNLPLFILIFIFPGAFINTLFGESFLGATTSLRYLAIGAFFASLSSLKTQLLAMRGKSKTNLFNALIITALNLTLCTLLIPKFGLEGAAISTMMSYISLSALLYIEVYLAIGVIPLRRSMAVLFLAAILSLMLTLLIKSFVPGSLLFALLLSLLFLIGYLLLSIGFGGLDSNDLLILKTIRVHISRLSKKQTAP